MGLVILPLLAEMVVIFNKDDSGEIEGCLSPSETNNNQDINM